MCSSWKALRNGTWRGVLELLRGPGGGGYLANGWHGLACSSVAQACWLGGVHKHALRQAEYGVGKRSSVTLASRNGSCAFNWATICVFRDARHDLL